MSVFDLLRDTFCDAWPGRQWRIMLFGYRVGIILQNEDATASLYVRNEPVRPCPSVADACLYIRERFETRSALETTVNAEMDPQPRREVRFPRHHRDE